MSAYSSQILMAGTKAALRVAGRFFVSFQLGEAMRLYSVFNSTCQRTHKNLP